MTVARAPDRRPKRRHVTASVARMLRIGDRGAEDHRARERPECVVRKVPDHDPGDTRAFVVDGHPGPKRRIGRRPIQKVLDVRPVVGTVRVHQPRRAPGHGIDQQRQQAGCRDREPLDVKPATPREPDPRSRRCCAASDGRGRITDKQRQPIHGSNSGRSGSDAARAAGLSLTFHAASSCAEPASVAASDLRHDLHFPREASGTRRFGAPWCWW